MKVSVIIPFTDRDANVLARAIDSVEKQTYPVFEIIRVYDIAYRGIPWARNTGVDKASGDAILPLDCDDWIDPPYLEKTVPLLEKDPQVGIASTQMVYFGEREGTVIKTWRRTYEEQLKWNNIPVCSLIRAEALNQAGPYDPNLRGWEDWDMWLRILRLGWKHDYIDEILFHYRLHSGGMNQWANENRATLIKYLVEKHPGFMKIRQTGSWEPDGTFRKEWNGL